MSRAKSLIDLCEAVDKYGVGQVIDVDWDGPSKALIASREGSDSYILKRVINGKPSNKDEDHCEVSKAELEDMMESKTEFNLIKFNDRKTYDAALRKFDSQIEFENEDPDELTLKVPSRVSDAIEDYLNDSSLYKVTFNIQEAVEDNGCYWVWTKRLSHLQKYDWVIERGYETEQDAYSAAKSIIHNGKRPVLAAIGTETMPGYLVNYGMTFKEVKSKPLAKAVNEALDLTTMMKAGKTYAVYMNDPRTNEWSYLMGYYEAKPNQDLKAFKKSMHPDWAYVYVFEEPVRDNKKVKEVGEK
jgi:hypothetical protein